jgi:hypothetical protein
VSAMSFHLSHIPSKVSHALSREKAVFSYHATAAWCVFIFIICVQDLNRPL